MDPEELASILDTDRVWSAYAMADLDPPYAAHAEWLAQPGAVVLCYRGFAPPVLFAHGEPGAVGDLVSAVQPGRYQYALLGVHRALLGERLRSDVEARMWRMALPQGGFVRTSAGDAARLSAADLPAVRDLFSGEATPPDAFQPSQLEQGCFYGVWEGTSLIAVAGTHVVSARRGVAAVGNVITRKDRRGRGLAKRTTSAVVAELLERGLSTIVLNVAMDNEPALRAYRALGFMPFCGYYEGVGQLLPGPALTEGNEDVRSV
ncbi:MAG TPA: GNAT family N-acetyltransferase [Anaerolineales bacterium]|nr:GNAT family N-acetyltransferase [Anaerolineales bacterium]